MQREFALDTPVLQECDVRENLLHNFFHNYEVKIVNFSKIQWMIIRKNWNRPEFGSDIKHYVKDTHHVKFKKKKKKKKKSNLIDLIGGPLAVLLHVVHDCSIQSRTLIAQSTRRPRRKRLFRQNYRRWSGRMRRGHPSEIYEA